MRPCPGEEQLKALQEEQRKIEAFQRELPFCMHLLNQAIEASREKLRERAMCYPENQPYNSPQHSPKRPLRLEEFIPLKKRLSYQNSVHTPRDIQTKEGDMSWIHQAHGQQGLLFSPSKEIKERETILKPCLERHASDCDQKSLFHSKQRVGGGAFLPFSSSSKEREVNLQPPLLESTHIDITTRNYVEPSKRNTDFDLMGSSKRREISKEEEEEEVEEEDDDGDGDGDEVVLVQGDGKKGGVLRSNNINGVRGHRKGRRCWSPELHRQFVSALVQLGGSLVATPKKIREVMKVDGLTNDEVKSHLQKYRLHSRRQINPCPTTMSSPHTQQLVVLGSIWMPSPPSKCNATSLCTPQEQQSSMVTHNLCNIPSREPHPHLHLHLPPYSNDHLQYRKAVSHHYPTTQSSIEVEGTDEDISKGSDTTLEF